MSAAPPPRYAWLLDAFGVAAWTFFIAVAIERLGHEFTSASRTALITLAVPLGYVLSDFATGFAHWFCDTFFEEDTPVLGPLLIRSFREHHRDPLSITRHHFLELNGSNCVAVAPVGASLLAIDPAASDAWLFVYATLVSLCLGTVATNQFHRWAHEPSPNALARFLQKCRLVLTPSHHAVHHAPPYARHYCVTNGWANVLMEKIRFWEAAERVLVAAGVPKSAEGEAPAASPDFAA
ncbi:MAG: fatty acid desaturase CarF family protein [Planctomycetota bacterium]